MGLLLADLQGFANGLRKRDAHGGLLGRLLPPALLGAMFWLVGLQLLRDPEHLRTLQQRGNAQAFLLAMALSPCPMIAGWIGFAHMQRQLFEAPELWLWLSAPRWRGRAALQVFVRGVGAALLWAGTLAVPFAAQVLYESRAPWTAWALLPLAVATAVVPALAATLAVQILLMRFANGRAARTLLALVSALASFGFPVFLLVEVFAGAPAQVQSMAHAETVDRGASPLVATAADLLATAARGALDLGLLQHCALLLGITVAAFLLLAPLHPVAAQNHLLAYRPRRVRGGRWPVQPAASIRHKELVTTMQQPGALWQMLIVLGMTALLASQQMIVGDILRPTALPRALREIAAMAMLWSLSVTMLLYAHMGRLAIQDGAQWPLWSQAPITPATLLRGKLQTIALLLLWPIALAAFAGVQWFGASIGTVLTFVGFACAGTLAALAVVAALGTWPWLVRQEADGRLTQGARGLAGSLLLMFAFHLAIAPGYIAWEVLLTKARIAKPDFGALLPTAMAVAFGLGLFEFAVAAWLALRNYRRLLAPR